jgi:hypothetical protein
MRDVPSNPKTIIIRIISIVSFTSACTYIHIYICVCVCVCAPMLVFSIGIGICSVTF